MRITKYTTILNTEREISLVKEKSLNYSCDTNLTSPTKVVDMMNSVFQAKDKTEEYIWVIALDCKNKVKGVFEVSHGGMDSAMISPREIFIRLCLCGASHFVMVHNHPTGDTTPSMQDMKVTETIKKAGNIMNIKLLDHIIIGNNNFLSMHEDEIL